MAEFTNVFVQQIAANGNAVFSETPVSGSNCIVHRDGSGIITLRGMTNQCRARYKVVFGGNIAIPTGGAWVPSPSLSPWRARPLEVRQLL